MNRGVIRKLMKFKKDGYIWDPIDESSVEDNSDERSITTNSLEDVWDRNMCIQILTQDMPDL